MALAILADHLGNDDKAQDLYQQFKSKVIGKLIAGKGWELTPDQIDETLAEIDASTKASAEQRI